MMTDTAEPTLDELRLLLAPHVAVAAVFDGWSQAALDAAAGATGHDPALVRYAFKAAPERTEQVAMIAAWIASIDDAMAAALPPELLRTMPVRARIRALVLARLEAVAGLEEAVRRAAAILAMPANARRALRLGWDSADAMWRQAGDTATDINHYTKRAILAGVYAATLARFVDDRSPDKDDTRAFLDRRIEGIMRFEKAKAQIFKPSGNSFSVPRLLGRLRYARYDSGR